jgi:hypothetical protein
MAIVALADLRASLARGETLFGLDLGEKTIGIAVADLTGIVATPLTTLARTKFTADAAKLFALMDGDRPATQHGWVARPAGPVDARLRQQPSAAEGNPHRLLGRAAFNRGGEPDPDR